MDTPHEFLFVCELYISESRVIFVVGKVCAVRLGAGEECSVFGCLREGGVCVYCAVFVCVGFEVGVSVGSGVP